MNAARRSIRCGNDSFARSKVDRVESPRLETRQGRAAAHDCTQVVSLLVPSWDQYDGPRHGKGHTQLRARSAFSFLPTARCLKNHARGAPPTEPIGRHLENLLGRSGRHDGHRWFSLLCWRAFIASSSFTHSVLEVSP